MIIIPPVEKLQKAKKSTRRVILLNNIIETFSNHPIFSDHVSRKSDTESMIQKSLFLTLQNNLYELLLKYGYSNRKSKRIAEKFQWEQKLTIHVRNFTVFSTSHRPDAVLDMEEIRIGIEIKKGQDGASLRAGLGQCLIYSTEYDFVVYLFVDTTPNRNIKKSIEAKREQMIIKTLWEDHNVLFHIV